MVRVVEVDPGKAIFRNVYPFALEHHSNYRYRQAENQKSGKDHKCDDSHVGFLVPGKRFEEKQEEDQPETDCRYRRSDEAEWIEKCFWNKPPHDFPLSVSE